MKTTRKNVTFKQLHDFCLKNANTEFVMNSAQHYLFSQYAIKVLGIKPNNIGSFCIFSQDGNNTIIKFMGKRPIDFPQKVIDMVDTMVNVDDEHFCYGKELAKRIAKLMK